MSFRTAALSTTLMSFALATPGLAQSTGEIALTIAGEEHVFPLDSSQSDWSGRESWPSISLSARAFNDDGEDPRVVSFSFDAGNWMPSLPELRFTRYEDGKAVQKLFSAEDAEDGALQVTLDSHSVTGSQLSVSGSIEGSMGTSDNYGRDIDLSDSVPVSGTFTATVEKLD